jgi:hypothetical protein
MNRFRRTSTSLAAVATAAALAVTLAAPPAGARTDDLAGLWLLNEGSGQVANDLSFSGNRGQLGSTSEADAHDPTWIALPRLFLLKRAALRFSGSQSVRMPDAPSLEPDGVTILARVRSTGPGAFRYVMSKGAFQCERASYGLYTGAAGGLRFYVSDGTQPHLSADAGTGIWDGAWHTVRGAFDGQELRLYVDGAHRGASPTGWRTVTTSTSATTAAPAPTRWASSATSTPRPSSATTTSTRAWPSRSGRGAGRGRGSGDRHTPSPPSPASYSMWP